MKYDLAAIMSKAWKDYYALFGKRKPLKRRMFSRLLQLAWSGAKADAARNAALRAERETEKAVVAPTGREAIQAEIDALEKQEFLLQMNDHWELDDYGEYARIRSQIKELRKSLVAYDKNNGRVA